MSQSPFPGMDPFLELDWLDVHSALVTYIRDQLQDQLPGDLLARMESRVLVEAEEGDKPRERHPDVRVVEAGGARDAGVAVLDLPEIGTIEPDMFLVEARAEPATQRYVEIVYSQTRSRVVTTIELISPSNKRRGPGQQLYLAKREECLAAQLNFVEIDLVRGGERLSILPQLACVRPATTYVGCVHRGGRPDKTALYAMPLDQRLKPMRIPLRPSDEDVVLHLQPLVDQAYQRGRYDRLDYSRRLEPSPAKDEVVMIEQFLKRAGKI